MTHTYSPRLRSLLLIAPLLLLSLPLTASAQAPAPLPRDADEHLLAELGERFVVMPSAHFLIYYDTTEIFARQRSRLFEQLHDTYAHTFDQIHVELRKSTGRLAVILFEDEEGFKQHLGLEGETRIAGVYNQETNRIVFYDANSDPDYLHVKALVRAISQELLAIRREINQIRHPTAKLRYVRLIGGHQKELAAYERKLDEMIANQNVAITIHESTHALTFNLGPFEPDAKPPRWLAEGVATLFETPRLGRWRGAARFNAPRYLAYRDARMNGELPSLRKLLTQPDLLLRTDTVDAAYGASWAFFYFLYHVHPDPCADMLQTLREPDTTSPDAPSSPADDNIVSDLELLVGRSVDLLEEDWHAFMDALAREFKSDIEGWQPPPPSR